MSIITLVGSLLEGAVGSLLEGVGSQLLGVQAEKSASFAALVP